MLRFVAAIVAALAISPAAAHAAEPEVFRLAEDGHAPQLGVDARGNAIAAWQADAAKTRGDPYEQTNAVFVSLRRAGGRFAKPRPVTRLDLAVATYALDVGASGDGAIAWQAAGAGGQVYVQRRRRGGGFGPAAALARSRGGREPAAAIDARGRLLVAWLAPSRRERCGMVVMATVAPRKGRFRAPKRLSDDCAHAGYLRAALARDGDGAVAWRSAGARSAISRSTIRIATFAGGRFHAQRAASAVGNVGETLALAAGGQRTLAVWRDKGDTANRVLAAAIGGDRIAAPVVVAATREVLLSDVQVALSPRDAAIVGWQRAPRGSSIWDSFATGEVAMRAAADGSFGAPDVLVEGIETASSYGLTGLAIDAAGRALAGYGDVVRRRPLAGPWGREIALHHRADYSDPDWPPSGDEISVALSDSGEGVALWDLEGPDGGSDYMRAAVIPAPG
ncbi:MAG: hypothetical protein QOE31_3635 [Solirubrobacteraceae bacterium]|nr:hypothetical protein [Solirubrobacteraceae bacterium]